MSLSWSNLFSFQSRCCSIFMWQIVLKSTDCLAAIFALQTKSSPVTIFQLLYTFPHVTRRQVPLPVLFTLFFIYAKKVSTWPLPTLPSYTAPSSVTLHHLMKNINKFNFLYPPSHYLHIPNALLSVSFILFISRRGFTAFRTIDFSHITTIIISFRWYLPRIYGSYEFFYLQLHHKMLYCSKVHIYSLLSLAM